MIVAAAICNAPTYVGGATQLGPSRKVTVGMDSIGGTVFHGFKASPGYGSLDNTMFTTAASNTYEIRSATTGNARLLFALDTLLTPADKNKLALHVCDQAYTFGAFNVVSPNYTFSNPSQDWSPHLERTLYVSQDTTGPTAESATVNGTELVITFNEPLGAAASLASSAFSGKKTPEGDSETALSFTSDAPSIVGNTVTLTLATGSSVVATDEDVKVTYTKPMSGTANKVVDKFGNEAATFTDEAVGNLLADMVSPTLATPTPVLAADGLILTLTFSEPLKDTSVPDKSAFTVKRTPTGGSQETVDLATSNSVTVNGSTVTLKLAAPIAHNDTAVKVSYTKPGAGSVIEDAIGNDLETFPDQDVTNNSTVPRVSMVAVHTDASPGIADAEFTVTRSNTDTGALVVDIAVTQAATYLDSTTQTITIPAGDTMKTASFRSNYTGNTSGNLTFTVTPSQNYVPALAPDNAATVRMKVPASGPTVKVAHGQVDVTVTEGKRLDLAVVFTTGAAVAQPRKDISVDLNSEESGTATINEDYTHFARNLPATVGDWTADGGGGYTFTYNQPVNIVEDDEYESDETFGVRLTYASGVSRVLTLPTGNALTAMITIIDDETLGVQSVAVTSTTGAYYRVGNTISFTVTFNGAVTVTSTPRFTFELGGQTRHANYASGSDSTDLVFSYRVGNDLDDHDGISWGANALGLNGGSIKFMHTDPAERVDAGLDHAAQGPLSAHKVDTNIPSLVEAEVDGTALTLTFSEELITTAPANTAFTVKVDGGSGMNPTAVSIAGRVVTLTLGAAVTSGQSATVSYVEPATNRIRDLSGLRAHAFTDRTVDFATDVVNFRAAPGNRRVTLSWDNPNDSTIVRYQYRYMSTSDSSWNPDWRNISGSGAGTTSYTTTGLTNGIEYTFQVRPVYRQGGQDLPGEGGRGGIGSEGSPDGAPQPACGLSRRWRARAHLGRPQRHHYHRLPVPPSEHVGRRVEP